MSSLTLYKPWFSNVRAISPNICAIIRICWDIGILVGNTERSGRDLAEPINYASWFMLDSAPMIRQSRIELVRAIYSAVLLHTVFPSFTC